MCITVVSIRFECPSDGFEGAMVVLLVLLVICIYLRDSQYAFLDQAILPI